MALARMPPCRHAAIALTVWCYDDGMVFRHRWPLALVGADA